MGKERQRQRWIKDCIYTQQNSLLVTQGMYLFPWPRSVLSFSLNGSGISWQHLKALGTVKVFKFVVGPLREIMQS